MMRSAWHIRDVVSEIAALPAGEDLPLRTVIVPSVFTGIALRRELAVAERRDLLVGTQFETADILAESTLRAAGVEFSSGEDGRRIARLLSVLRSDTTLRYFSRDLFLRTPGWEAAFGRTITELEAAGLDAETFGSLATNDRERDLAAVWEAIDKLAGRSWTIERIYREASVRAKRRHATIAVITGEESAARASFLRALGATVVWLAARPLDPALEHRLSSFWDADGGALEALAIRERTSTARGRVATRFFDRTSDAPGDDDETLLFEEFAGIDEEVEAAVDWVTREVLERGTPLGEIAILVPRTDPFGWMVADRLGRIPWPTTRPAFVASGRPAIHTAGGSRLLAVLRALREGLPAEAVARTIPSLRAARGPFQSLSRSEAVRAVTAIATPGGSAFAREGARTWIPHLEERIALLESRAGLPATGIREAKTKEEEQERLGILKAVRPALVALCGLSQEIDRGETAVTLVARLVTFLREWLLSPGEGPHIADIVEAPLLDAVAHGAGEALTGVDALDAILACISEIRVVEGRFGEPAIFIGTLEQAAGLPFTAVRVLGLAEGGIPAALHDDPVLPDADRKRIAHLTLRAERPFAELRAFHRVTLHAEARIALSTPLTSFEGTEREPSALVLEAARAVDGTVLSLAALRAERCVPARAARLRFRAEHGVGESARLDRAAMSRATPRSWRHLEIRDDDLAVLPAANMLGLSPERPLTAHGFHRLLQCPFRFAHEYVLGVRRPLGVPDPSEIDPEWYGTLFHAAIEDLYREHGAAIVRAESSSLWEDEACRRAASVFVEFSRWRPFDEGAREAYLLRLQRDVAAFVRSDAGTGVEFVDVERPFGWDAPLAIGVGDGQVFVRGFFDRIDLEQGTTVVRDLKTGARRIRAGRDEGPSIERDGQLAFYARVLLAEGRAPVHGAYVHAGAWGIEERAFRQDADRLHSAAEAWLLAARDLLVSGTFPRSPHVEDCGYCPIGALCDPGARDRDLFYDVPALRRFVGIKEPE